MFPGFFSFFKEVEESVKLCSGISDYENNDKMGTKKASLIYVWQMV